MDQGRWLREARIESSQTQAAASCFAARDPLEAEISLERERWNTVQRLSSLHAFDLDTIAAYMLMLQISARIASFDRERGAAGYGRLYSDILGPAGTGGAETKPSGVQA
ncbi:MAG: hypothetical protein HGB17_19020 [Syntrophobacteraceae bacterium]|nr:hypothetical protein [Syntrophobacteraceae bacterium]